MEIKNVKYNIYQLPCRNVKVFRSYEKGSIIDLKEYELAYKNVKHYNKVKERSDEEICEDLFVMYNRSDHPVSFAGRSMSVSDVVEVNNKFYFCDSFGFIDVTDKIIR